MGDEIQNIEKKNLGVYEFFNTPKFEHWDSQYKKGKLRKDILKYYNKIFNKLSKILKKTTKIANSKPKKSIY